MNKDDLGYPLRLTGKSAEDIQPAFLIVSAIVVHGVNEDRKTDLEMHVRPPHNGWKKGPVVSVAPSSIRLTADRAYEFRKTEAGVLCSKDQEEEKLLDQKSAEVILCVMDQVQSQCKKPAPIQHKMKR